MSYNTFANMVLFQNYYRYEGDIYTVYAFQYTDMFYHKKPFSEKK